MHILDSQQLKCRKTINLNRNPFASPTEEAIGADFVGRKSVLKNKFKNYSESLTEYEIMKENGYHRIWDCGTIRYDLDL